MKHSIDPKVDCVFKAILGAQEHTNLLIHFLNATLAGELESPIVSVEILNPGHQPKTGQPSNRTLKDSRFFFDLSEPKSYP